MERASSYKQLFKKPLGDHQKPGETIAEQKVMSEELQKKITLFEREHGIVRLLKLFNQVIFKIMIKNNLMTSNELRQMLIEDIEKFKKTLLPEELKGEPRKNG